MRIGRIGLIVLLVFIGLAPIFLPMVTHPELAGVILLHGGGGVVLIMLGVVSGSIYWVKRTVKARTAAFGEHDKARAGLVSLDVWAKWIYGSMIVAGLGVAFLLAQGAMRLTRIEHHGARATADVLSIYTDTCGKHGCRVEVEYGFKPEGRNAAQTDYAYLADSENQGSNSLLEICLNLIHTLQNGKVGWHR